MSFGVEWIETESPRRSVESTTLTPSILGFAAGTFFGCANVG